MDRARRVTQGEGSNRKARFSKGLLNELSKIAFANIRKIVRPKRQPQTILDWSTGGGLTGFAAMRWVHPSVEQRDWCRRAWWSWSRRARTSLNTSSTTATSLMDPDPGRPARHELALDVVLPIRLHPRLADLPLGAEVSPGLTPRESTIHHYARRLILDDPSRTGRGE